jgi:hypothetical protein
LEDQVGIGLGCNGEDRQGRVPGAKPFDRRQAGGQVEADVDDPEIGHGLFSGATFDHANRNTSGPEQLRGAAAEVFVLRNDQSGELCHVSLSDSKERVPKDRKGQQEHNGNACAGWAGCLCAT